MNVRGWSKQVLGAGVLAACMMGLSASLTGCLTSDSGSKTDTTAKTDTTPVPLKAAVTLTVGAQANKTLGSAVDLDVPKVLLSADANKALSSLDLVFFFTDGGDFEIGSPVAAKAAGISVAKNYVDAQIKEIDIAKASTPPGNSQEAAKIFEATPKVHEAVVFGDDHFLVKTGAGKLVYLHITTITGTDNTGSAEFKVSLSGL